jgi:hypothetical protein
MSTGAELSRTRNSASGVEPPEQGRKPMRIAYAIPLLLLGACQVSKDNNNGTTSVTYNSDVAENAANDIGNDVQKTGEKIENKVGNASISVKVGKDEKTANASENKAK